MSTFIYCNRWSWHRKVALEQWPEAKARKAHVKGKPYAVLVGDLLRPDCIIEVALNLNGAIMITFLDHLLRPCQVYGFKRLENRMFLGQVEERIFREETEDLVRLDQ